MDPEIILLDKIRQTQKDRYNMTFLIYEIWKKYENIRWNITE
jgi:hypothetical protein